MRKRAPRLKRRGAATARCGMFAVVIASGFPADNAKAQVRIRVERPGAAIEAGGPLAPLTEPHVAVSPTDPGHLVIGAIVAPTDSVSAWNCAAFATSDGGDSWIRHDFDIDRCIDPWVTFLPSGDVSLVALELTRGMTTDDRFHLVAFRSADGGRTWSDRQSLGRGHEHPMTFIARGDSDSTVYLVSRRMNDRAATGPRHAVSLHRSRDDGRTFEEVAELRPVNLGMTPAGLAWLPDGSLAIGFSNDAPPVHGADRQRAWLYRSLPDRATFAYPPRLVTEECATGAAQSVFPGHAFFTGDAEGHLYYACVGSELRQVVLLRSEDAGGTWERPVRLGPHTGETPGQVRTAMVAVSPRGTVGVAWYGRHADTREECYDFYFTASADRGVTFAAPVRVSSERSCPLTPENGRAGRSWRMGGDYTSITAGEAGAFHLVWADSRSGRFVLRYAVVRAER